MNPVDAEIMGTLLELSTQDNPAYSASAWENVGRIDIFQARTVVTCRFDEEIPNNRTLCDELDKPDAALYELGWYMLYYLNVYYEPREST